MVTFQSQSGQDPLIRTLFWPKSKGHHEGNLLRSLLLPFCLIVLIVGCRPITQNRLQAVDGVIDSSGISNREEFFEVHGKWWFLADAHVAPEAFQRLKDEAQAIDKLSWIGRPEGSYGRGSFGVEFKDLKADRYTLGLPPIGSSYRAFVIREADRKVVAQTQLGRFAETGKPAIPTIMSRSLEFAADQEGSYFLLIQVSNDAIRHGGFWEKLTFGRASAMALQDRQQLFRLLASMVALFVMGLYCFSLYARRLEDTASLWLGLLCLFTSLVLYVSIKDCVLFDWDHFEAIDFRLWVAIRYLNITLIPLFSLLFVHRSWPRYVLPYTERYFVVVNSSLTLFACLASSQIVTQYAFLLQLNSLACFVVQVTVVVRASLGGDKAARVSIIGYILGLCAVVFDITMIALGLDGPRLFTYGVLILLFLQTQVTGIRFAEAFRQAAHLSLKLQDEVDRQTRDIKSILKSMRQGIFAIQAKDKKTDNQNSEYLQKILHTQEIQGKTIGELLLRRADLSDDVKSQVEASLDACLGENLLAFELNEANLVKELNFKGDRPQTFELDWAPMLDPAQNIEKILVCIRDVTEMRELQSQAREKEQNLLMILELLSIPEDQFQRFLKNTEHFIQENRHFIKESSYPRPDVVKRLFVNMHTIKGSARTYMLKFLSDQSHLIEQTYVNILQGSSEWNKTQLLTDLQSIDEILGRYQRLARDKLGWNLEQKEVRLPKALMEKTIEQMSRIEHLNSVQQAALDEARGWLVEHCSSRISLVVDELRPGLQSMARDLGKDMPQITITEGSIWLFDVASNILHSCFVHMFRNSLDHGLEKPEERIRKGKPARGHILIQAHIVPQGLQIQFSDDGRGLNLDRIQNLGLQRRLLESSENEPQKLAELIMQPGFSTKDEVSEISGRGVGMDAVRTFLEEQGGSITIELGSTQNRQHVPFLMNILLPLDLSLELTEGMPGKIPKQTA